METKAKMQVENLNVYYGTNHAIVDASMRVPLNRVTALIGPSGCGKSTFIRCLNRMNDVIEEARIEGAIYLDEENIYGRNVDVVKLRKRVGMVFQKPNPFPKSIYDNVAYGPQVHGMHRVEELDAVVENSLKRAALWDEVKDRMQDSALSLSGGQQQRLCIARCLAVNPEIVLMDEPCSALDPIATTKIEDLMDRLKREYTVVIVTHNMQQAARVSDFTGYFYLGRLIEFGETKQIFENPREESTENYITGRFG